jgi:hypothetical protein
MAKTTKLLAGNKLLSWKKAVIPYVLGLDN